MEHTPTPVSDDKPDSTVLVGSYAEADRVGITRLVMASRELGVEPDGVVLRNASWLERWDDHLVLAVSEAESSELCLVRVTADGRGEVLDRRTTHGADACHLAISPDRRHVAVANYSSGSVALFAAPRHDALDEAVACIEFHGDGPVMGRQEGPHAHQVTWLDDDHLLVCDLGADVVRVLRVVERTIDATGGSGEGWAATTLDEVGQVNLPPGFGPRHLVLRRSELLHEPMAVQLALGGELSGQLACISHGGDDWATGWTIVDLVPGTAERSPSGELPNQPSGLVWFGDDLVLANRSIDTLARFAWADNGALTPVTESSCQGQHPRDLAEHNGHLWVANQHSDSVVVLAASANGFDEVACASVPAPARILVR